MMNSLTLTTTYDIYKNMDTGAIGVFTDIKNAKDAGVDYTFNPDGSATSHSIAWGTKTELPPGTFSDLMLNLPKTNELTSKNGKQLVDAYNEMIAKNKH